jgi:hypothetical protein
LNGTPTGADAGSHPVSLSVSDGLLSVTQNFTVVVAPVVTFGYDVWAANKGVGAANADHDNDGRNNFCEYALDGNPTNDQDIGVSPILLRAGDGFEYIHLQRNDDTNLVYIVEACTDLFSGVWTKDGISVLGTNAYSVKYDEVIYGVSATNQYSFIRLGIEGR